ncbi:peptidoglycan D,D-transpeptidase FtsI family protein, partial [Dietzia sp.]|uniref:peptidoglycan D,D-transpeptidase FtsI family protein n=1 Tax=Dietzia sp. TaxID=1871616 RepID=UPI002FDAC26A
MDARKPKGRGEDPRAPQGPKRPRGSRPAGMGRSPRPGKGGTATDSRFKILRTVVVVILVIALVKLLWVQTIGGRDLAAQAESQRQVEQVLPATRGEITDERGEPIAFTREARSLSIQPTVEKKNATERHQTDPTKPDWDTLVDQISSKFEQVLGDQAKKSQIKDKLDSDSGFTYLVRNIDVSQANEITKDFPMVGSERVDLREYPGGSLAANVIGATNYGDNGRIQGLQGMEAAYDDVLGGQDGKRTLDITPDNAVIPGSMHTAQEATDGSDVQLTLDSDLQWYVQRAVQSAKDASGANGASAVVLDAKTGEVRAMANDNTFNPAVGIGPELKRGADLGNKAITTPFEPGSVNKIITASAAIEDGVTTPEEVLNVPGSINMEGVTVNDAWEHGPAPYTTTGVFGKSSNVGTLMLAQRVGKDSYADFLQKFGLGQKTGIELEGESEGMVPDRKNWQGGTFANLPIGQGLSMTLLQMTSLFQTVANDGVRVPPRIVKDITKPDGSTEETQRPDGVQVMSKDTADTVLD